MKIAVSATGPSLDAQVEPRFGRCKYFVIIDAESMQFEAMENPNIAVGGGAGIAAAQMIVDKGVRVVLTGNCGPNAYQTLSAVGIQVITGVSGKIKEAAEAYKAGKLRPNAQPSVGSHYGMGQGVGRGMGIGRGMGMGSGTIPQAVPPTMSRKQEIEMLKNQAQVLGQKLGEIQRRLEELEKGR
jgi:predicted Fe-Mo cluster-binding NifX family protein